MSARFSERSGLNTSSVNTNNGDGICSTSSQISNEDLRDIGGIRSGNCTIWSDGYDPRNALSGGIRPSQTQIGDMIGVIGTESTTREFIGEIDWSCRRWWRDG